LVVSDVSGPGLPCVHCGLCLDSCPTYRVFGTEAESPRGRIHIMEAVKRGSLELDDHATRHLDQCLGCLACETACPSGVSFRERIEEFRPQLPLRPSTRAWRQIISRVATSAWLMRSARGAARAVDSVGLERVRRRVPGLAIFPSRARRSRLGWASKVKPVPAPATPRATIALLRGCAATVLGGEINDAATAVLHRNGIAVVDAPGQRCCGALALHGGREHQARDFARNNVAAFTAVAADFIVTTAAGCGAMLKDYGRLLSGDGCAGAARMVAANARDVSEVLCAVGIVAPRAPLRLPGTVAYHDACHLLHAARLHAPPRSVVAAAIGAEPADLGENYLCCGGAGSYNLERPSIARQLGARKAHLAKERAAAMVAVGNIGCMLQLELAFNLAGLDVALVHPAELLEAAYAYSERPPARR
jgi:glycolate dehydrogenase iron-sulfur subunit